MESFLFCVFVIIMLLFCMFPKNKTKNEDSIQTMKFYKSQYLEYAIDKYMYLSKCNRSIKGLYLTTANNNTYYGEVKDGFKHGCGTLFYANGGVYKGIWENDLQQGFGIYMYNNNELISGNKKNGKYHGVIKIHTDTIKKDTILSIYCVYTEGLLTKCLIEYINKKILTVTGETLNSLQIFINI